MESTTNLKMTLLAMNQSQKEVTVNEALVTIDSLINNCADSFVDKLPEEKFAGDRIYILPEKPAYYYNGWRYIKPKEGLILWVKKERKLYVYSEDKWLPY
jgi:hypothetical protein